MSIAPDATIALREATEDDVDFLTWVMLTASRSHLERGIWEYLNDQGEAETRTFLRALALTETVHIFHHSLFLVAEVDGVPAAGMCAYDSSTQGFGVVGSVMPGASAAAGVRTDDPEFGRRLGVMMEGFAHKVELPPVVWTIENVATKPEFRRRGLVDALLTEHLARGRARGYTHASIGVYLGNEAARAAYRKAGFEVVSTALSDGWAAEIGCPGTELLLQDL